MKIQKQRFVASHTEGERGGAGGRWAHQAEEVLTFATCGNRVQFVCVVPLTVLGAGSQQVDDVLVLPDHLHHFHF